MHRIKRNPESRYYSMSLIGTAIAILALVALVSLPHSGFAADGKRQKVIDFEDDLVEGMNKRPLDSLSQLSERNKKKKKSHLYRKRVGFRTETAETLREMRYMQ